MGQNTDRLHLSASLENKNIVLEQRPGRNKILKVLNNSIKKIEEMLT